MPDNQILIGISSCLLGEEVRFDTGHKHSSFITGTLGQYFTFRSFCPEMAIGLGTPRETLRLVHKEDGIHCVGNKTASLDVTDKMIRNAEEQRSWQQELCGYILKKDSPSCGMERVRVYKGDMPERNGTGLYARVLMENFPNLPVEEEGRLGDPVLRENFIKRVFVFRHWKDLVAEGLTTHRLMDFHAQYKFVLMSHDQNRARALGRRLAEASGEPVEENEENPYIEQKFSLFHSLSDTRKLAYEALYRKLSVEDSPFDDDEIFDIEDNYYNHFQLQIRYRQQAWRPWFYVEFWPIVGWPEERDYDTVLGARIRLEVNLGGSGDQRLDE